MIYILLILWVALFVYLAERQFKKIKNEEFRQDDYVSTFERLKQILQKKSKTNKEQIK